MALGRLRKDRGFQAPEDLLGDRLGGIYRLLATHGDELFGEDYFADLFTSSSRGRPTVPGRVLATVMTLQSFEGLSDREAVDRVSRDLAWQAAAGLAAGAESFDHTVLVRMRALLCKSDRPKRFLEDTVVMARAAGVLSDRARVVDSTPIFDAVATQDTVTQLRAVIRTLLRMLDRRGDGQASEVRAVLVRDDDYKAPGKPSCDWGDPDAREALVDELVRDVLAAVAVFEGRVVDPELADHLAFMVYIAGQDTETDDNGRFRIARKVAKDRVISTVDREARHGHKSKARLFDGYKAHLRSDPDGEIIDEVVVTAANTPDAGPLPGLLDDLVETQANTGEAPVIYGDAGYGAASTLEWLDEAGLGFVIKVPTPTRRAGRWSKADFGVDTEVGTVTCPTGVTVAIRFRSDGSGVARFAEACERCPLREHCTTAETGRTISIHRREDILQTERFTQASDPDWNDSYTGDRPKVERKLAHLIRKPWGGRRARMRGATRIEGDLVSRAAAINLDRMSRLGVIWNAASGWQVQPP